MKKRTVLKTLLICTFYFLNMQCFPKHAVINCPVADLLGEPLHKNVYAGYKQIPLHTDNNTCRRVHQALFNELVTIVDQTEYEYCVEITNAYFVTQTSTKPQSRYWTLKENCSLLTDEIQKTVPTPISYKSTQHSRKKPTIVLTQPYHDRISFSAGTRLVYCPAKSDGEIITAIRYDFVKKRITSFDIHRSACRVENEALCSPETRHEMIALIRSWINESHKRVVPYVWGGCSYVYRYSGNFKRQWNDYIESCAYTYPRTKHTPHTGFDCSCLILRAAQIVGVPFFCKNSFTMAAKLKEVKDYKDVQIGDIIWIPGHVILIADLERNTTIEARGYPHYYGKLQEIPLAEQFKGIHSIKQLIEHRNANKPLLRLNKEGTVVTTIPQYKILKLC